MPITINNTIKNHRITTNYLFARCAPSLAGSKVIDRNVIQILYCTYTQPLLACSVIAPTKFVGDSNHASRSLVAPERLVAYRQMITKLLPCALAVVASAPWWWSTVY